MQETNTPPRITMQTISDYFLGIFNLERGLFYTIRELMLRPGEAIHNFLFTEKRIMHIKPMNFLILTVSVGIFLTLQTLENLDGEVISDGIFNVGEQQDPEVKEIVGIVNGWISKYFNVFQMLKIPFIALTTFLLFKKAKLNYAEHLVINSYILGFSTVIYAIILPLNWFGNNVLVLFTLLAILYNFWAYFQIFKEKKLATTLKTIVVIFVGNLLHGLFFFGILAILYFLN